MISHYRSLQFGAQRAADLVVVALSFLLAWYVRFHTPFVPLRYGDPGFKPYLILLGVVLIVWALILQIGLAGRMRGYRTFGEEVVALLQAHAVALLLVFTLTFFIREYSYSRVMMVLFWVISTLLLILERFWVRSLLRGFARRGYRLRQILLVGAGAPALQVLRRFQRHPELGFRFAGVATRAPGALGQRMRRVPILGNYADTGRLVQETQADLVILALPHEDHAAFGPILEALDQAMIDVWVVPDFLSQVRLRGGITEFDGLPLFSLQASPMAGWNRLAKRGMDLLLAGAALLLLLPLLGLIVAAIRLTSRGPVLYRQERMGLDGRRFQILKFRSMVPESEPDGARFAADADPRVTTLGRILRKASLDELPQLLNVLRGEMSLVGPRPERPVFIQDFRGHFPRYMLRHRVKSGMTGLAQVYGWRGNTSVKKRLEHDLFYIEHWSLWLDMKILWMTIPAILRGKGAL